MKNIIHRNTTVVIYKQLVDTTAGKKGDLFRAWKDATGWHTKNITTNNPQIFYGFISHLRNEHFTRIITQY